MRAKAMEAVRHSVFDTLAPQPPDALLSVMAAYRSDPRENKIDLGVGMYRNAKGITPVMQAVKAAERKLLESQTTKGYMGSEGDARFVSLLRPIVFGSSWAESERVVGVQTPGGTGALRLGAELIAAAAPTAKVWLGSPAWPNYRPLITAARLPIEPYAHVDAGGRANVSGLLEVIAKAAPGDAVVLQACCHNPTGVEFSLDEWRALADAMASRGLLPVLDCAYQGLGAGLDEDVAGLRVVLEKVPEALIAYSCDKNFGVYRERVGALYAFAASGRAAQAVLTNMLALARGNWSMPSDHGAAAVRLVLEDAELRRVWRDELDEMRLRINGNRRALAQADARFAQVARQHGMFSVINLTPSQIARLKDDHAIYMATSGRINVAGFGEGAIDRFVDAVRKVAPTA